MVLKRFRMALRRPRPAVFLLVVLSGVTQADGLSFEQALQAAEARAPQLAAHQAALAGAHEAVAPAEALPDPKAFVGVDNLPVNGPDRYSLTRDFMTMRKIGLMQDVPNAAKRQAHRDAARAEVTKQEVDLALARIAVRTEVANAWLNRYYMEQQLSAVEAQQRDNALLQHTVDAQLAAGKGMAADALSPRQEAVALANRHDELERDRDTATAALRRWVGDAAGQSLIGEPPAFALDPSLLYGHLEHRPDLLQYESMEEQARAELHEAQAAKKPDWSVELAYAQRGPAFSNMVSLQISADLPLFTGSRQDPRIRAKEKALLSIEDERRDMVREHEANLAADLASATALQRQRDRLDQVALPLATQKVELQLAAYRAGRGDLNAVIIARRELHDTQLQRIDVQHQYQTLVTRLHFLFEAYEDGTP